MMSIANIVLVCVIVARSSSGARRSSTRPHFWEWNPGAGAG